MTTMSNDSKVDGPPSSETRVEVDRVEVLPRVSMDDDVEKPNDQPRLLLKSEQDKLGIRKTVWKFKKAFFICTMLCWAAAADGYQINLNGAIIANLGFIQHLGQPRASDGKVVILGTHNALWGAMQSLGQLLAMIGLNPISDRIGRKWTLYVLWCILCGSLMLETFVVDWKMWAGAKLLAGMGVGAIQSTLPVYIAEWSPVNIRGMMILSYGVINNFGNFIAPVVLKAAETVDPMDWRTPILTQWAFLGIMLPIFLWLPETPSYFAARGLHEQGLAVMHRVFGKVEGYDCEAEYSVFVNTIEEERRARNEDSQQSLTFGEVLRSYAACFKGVNFRRTIAASLPAVLQQTNGLSLINIYGALFFRQAGFTDPFGIKATITALKIVGVLIVIGIADKFGRRKIVVLGGWWCFAMLIVVGAAGAHVDKSPHLANLTVACASLWSLGSAALGSLGWTFVGEVASSRLRARTAGLAAGIGVLFGLTFNTSVPIMLDASGRNLGFKTCWIFVGLGGLANALAFAFIPEPAGRSPAELDELYEKRIPAWRMRGFVTDVEKDMQQSGGGWGGARRAAAAEVLV